MILYIPTGPRQRGYGKTRVDVRHLLDGHWRSKDQLLLETTPPVAPAPLRTLRRRHRGTKIDQKPKIVKAITKTTTLNRA